MDYLAEYATKNIWCSPFQDKPAIFQPARLTGFSPAKRYFKYAWSHLNLPDSVNEYHVYQIGQNCPIKYGLFDQTNQWIRLSDLITDTGLLIEAYLLNGLMIPKTETWICRTYDNNFLVCSRHFPKIANLHNHALYLRFYSNAYFGRDAGIGKGVDYICGGGLMTTVAAINAFYAKVSGLAQREGYVTLFKNGRYTTRIDASNTVPGDVVEYILDPAVDAVVDFKVSDLPSFTSTLDSLDKLILHPPKRGDAVIYYRDDITIFVTKRINGVTGGKLYHRSYDKSLRMLTHRDYAIPSSYITEYVVNDPVWQNDVTGLELRVILRKSGYDRPLVFETNRIHELYKLSDTKILRAMEGLDSGIEGWQADTLESSMYTYLMRCMFGEITGEKTAEALGYHPLSKVIADSPTKVTFLGNGSGVVDLPFSLSTNSTMYEYDSNGLLLGWYRHLSGSRYFTHNLAATLVEGIVGIGDKQLDLWYGKVDIKINPDYNYRYYISREQNGVTLNDWREVKPEEGLYTITDGVFRWNYTEGYMVGCVKSDYKFSAYRLIMEKVDGFFQLHFNYTDMQAIVLELPPGKVELWLNGRALTPGLDCYIDWPVCVIVNKEWVNVTGSNTIDVRATGFCEPDGTLPAFDAQIGFVKHGLLSLDSVYNLRDDKVIRCVADGRTFHRDDLVFAEQFYGVMVTQASQLAEGRPYWISDVVVPLPPSSGLDYMALRKEDDIQADAISKYLTTQMEEPTFDTPVMIKRRFVLYSPFITKLIYDIQARVFVPPKMPTSDQIVMESIADYEWILPYDPARRNLDAQYVVIHPHPWSRTRSVSENDYAFLKRVTDIYLNDLVDLTQFVTIKG